MTNADDGTAIPTFDALLREWLYQLAYQLDGTMRVAGVTEQSLRAEVVQSFTATLAGLLRPDDFSEGFAITLGFANGHGDTVGDDGTCDYRFEADAAVDRLRTHWARYR